MEGSYLSSVWLVIRAILQVLGVQAKDGKAALQLTHQKKAPPTRTRSPLWSATQSNITWRSGLSSMGMRKETQFLTTKKESVTDSDLYKP